MVTVAVNMEGWSLRDVAGNRWSLSSLGALAPGQEVVITRQGKPMSLNNNGDTVELLDAGDEMVQVVTYGPVERGETVRPGN